MFFSTNIYGDAYFKIHYENQNLDRTRTRFKLIVDIETNEEDLNKELKSIINHL